MLTLDNIVNVSVSLSGIPAARSGFDTGLILGESTIIPASERVRTYTDVAGMFEDGFSAESPEYLAATLYFSQSPKPAKLIVGVKGDEEAYLAALTACREANSEWYIAYIPGADTTDITACAAYVEALSSSVFFFDTAAEGVLTAEEESLFVSLKALKYERTLGMYAPEGAYLGAALMGRALGMNTGAANSAYTLAYKSLKGVSPSDLTAAQVDAIKGANGNAYILRAGTYSVFEQGVMASGEHFDTRIGLDQLAYNLQRAGVDLLSNTTSKIPQTESGMTQIKTALAAECDAAVRTGFLAPGVWNGPEILGLATGDTLSAGYLIQSESIDAQTVSERATRVAPRIYIALKLAGAVESVIVSVTVDR